jgi:MFS family permease
LAVLGVVNLVVAATGVALLPLAERVWTHGAPTWSDASAYGLATGALGFGALGGPLLGRRGVGIDTRMRRGLWVAGAALATACLAPSVLWVAVPLLLVGAAAVSAEAAATELLQDAVADDRRAGILGVADSVMVLAALVGALVSPLVADWWGPRGVLWLLASGCLLAGVQLRHRAGPALPEPRGSAAPTLVE